MESHTFTSLLFLLLSYVANTTLVYLAITQILINHPSKVVPVPYKTVFPSFSRSIKEFFKERVYDTIIPRLIKLAEAPSHGKTILDYDPKGKGTKAYLNLAKEVIERNGTKEESIG